MKGGEWHGHGGVIPRESYITKGGIPCNIIIINMFETLMKFWVKIGYQQERDCGELCLKYFEYYFWYIGDHLIEMV